MIVLAEELPLFYFGWYDKYFCWVDWFWWPLLSIGKIAVFPCTWRSLAKLPLGGKPWANNGHFWCHYVAPTSEFSVKWMPCTSWTLPQLVRMPCGFLGGRPKPNLQAAILYDMTSPLTTKNGRRESHGFLCFWGAIYLTVSPFFFFRMSVCCPKGAHGQVKELKIRGTGPEGGPIRAKGGQAVPLVEGFFVFSFPPGSVVIIYLSLIFWSK